MSVKTQDSVDSSHHKNNAISTGCVFFHKIYLTVQLQQLLLLQLMLTHFNLTVNIKSGLVIYKLNNFPSARVFRLCY